MFKHSLLLLFSKTKSGPPVPGENMVTEADENMVTEADEQMITENT